MKGIYLSVVLLLLGSCAALQSSRLPDLAGGESIAESFKLQIRQSCERNFISGNWQLVHSITFKMANGHGATVIGVTSLTEQGIDCSLVTVEGLTLFDAEIEIKLQNAGLKFTRSKSGRKAIFCRDYDGNGVELIEKQ